MNITQDNILIKRSSKEFIDNLLNNNPSWKILDIGCGYSAHPKATVLCDVQNLSNFYNGKNFIKLENNILPFKDKEFDFVIASHVIEHVNDRNTFLSDISNLCRPGGLVVFTTINDSFLGALFGKYFAEDILKILPEGTHEVEKFISPENLAIEAERHGIILDNFTGFSPTFRLENIINKEFGNFKFSSNMQINYGAAGIKL